MTSLRKRKAAICQALLECNLDRRLEDLAWDQMTPVGREFGSPDFDRLMDVDFRNRAGVFDRALKDLFAELDAPEKLPVLRRRRI